MTGEDATGCHLGNQNLLGSLCSESRQAGTPSLTRRWKTPTAFPHAAWQGWEGRRESVLQEGEKMNRWRDAGNLHLQSFKTGAIVKLSTHHFI